VNAAAEQISAFASVAELGRALADGSTTSTEIVERVLGRIAAHDGELRAVRWTAFRSR
jgi:aspartyl-tRNA(Asn)/glutamyl-tRNA(Gln) amidotransferase subunit A